MNTHAESMRDPEAIERRNEELRADMTQTLQALERKLSPGQLVDRALELVREHGGEIAVNLGNSAKQNPVPLLLTAVGLVWMMSSSGRPRTSRSESRGNGYDRDYESYGATDDSHEPSLRERIGDRLDSTREHLSEAKAKINDAGERLSERAETIRGHMKDSTQSLRGSASSAAARGRSLRASAQSRAREVKNTVGTTLEEHPLALAAIGISVGALLAAALPATEREDRLLGPAREKTLARARTLGAQQYDRVREKARETATNVVKGAVDGAQRAIHDEQRPH
jgi:hypothetical protein